jgi:4-hydroxy-3-polyprenylbenzoate decarboxylase
LTPNSQNKDYSEYKILLAVTGASGSIYAQRMLEFLLLSSVGRIYIVCSDAGKKVVDFELKKSAEQGSLKRILSGELTEAEKNKIRIFHHDDLFAPVASGSSVPDSMVILPCSMGTLSRVAGGMSSNLLERSADVMLKQKKKLIVCPRETPFSHIHLKNMLELSELGVDIVPPMPAFYQKPKTIDDMVDFVVGKVCEMLEFSHEFYEPWNKRMR